MISEFILRTYDLADGCRACITDETRHYYGGYYHVRLQVVADVTLRPDLFDSQAMYDHALECLGNTVRFQRMLEKMAVPEMEIDGVRLGLLNAFETNLLPYLVRPDFPRRFVTSEHDKARAAASPVRTWKPQ